ncbi:Cysteine proteinases superfamily protein [Euphorbia peplus]|nr:Cysteine proteinases superfamily protein [Euphorbia peplus]
MTQRLQFFGLCELEVAKDGNCQFRAVSDQVFSCPEYHKKIRKDVVKQLKDNRGLYESYVPMKYKLYCQKMAKSGEWGDHVTLQAAADKYAAKVTLITSFENDCFIDILPRLDLPKCEFRLSFWSEAQHCNSFSNIYFVSIIN